MDRAAFLEKRFIGRLPFEPTPCQRRLMCEVALFLTGDDGDILVVNGYAGTGKTTAIASIVSVMTELETECILLAPTGRSAKVLSSYTGHPAFTIHKHIYRQKSHGADGFGEFSLSPNKARGALLIVDEVSLIGIDSGERGGASFGTGNLLEDLVQFLRSGVDCRMIMVGDAAQLPPIGLDASPALSPEYMSGAGGVLFSTLTTVVRQQEQSGILAAATKVRNMISSGDEEVPLDALGLDVRHFSDIERVSGAELIEALSDAYARYGEDETVVLCRSNRRANRYNAGIRAQVLFREEELVREDKVMIVRNCYRYADTLEGTDYIANGDIARVMKIGGWEERYGLRFAKATLAFPDYGDQEIKATVLLDTLSSESPSLTYEQSNALYRGVDADYASITSKKKRYEAVREDSFFNALQLKYAAAITGHKSQGGQWKCVFIDNPLWQDILVADDLKWLYTALTRAVEKVYLVNFKDRAFL